MKHLTQAFISNPQGLRVEYCFDTEALLLWWSPGNSGILDMETLNFSNRDNHLDIFEKISFPGFGLENFKRCDWDPYRMIFHFSDKILSIQTFIDHPVVLIHCDQSLGIQFKTGRYDKALLQNEKQALFLHPEPAFDFEFAVQLAEGPGKLRHSHIHSRYNSHYFLAELDAGQEVIIGVGLKGEKILNTLETLSEKPGNSHWNALNERLESELASGKVYSTAYPELAELRTLCARSLHAMMNQVGAYRAALKEVYYLIWVRDGGMSMPYQAATGWPYLLKEFCLLLLENPTTVNEEGSPKGRIFAQLINKTYGRLEEDGLFYVLWCLHSYKTQVGNLDFVEDRHWLLIAEALDWVEEMTWDEKRGLYGSHFADESPTWGHRDHFTDYAMGTPTLRDNAMKHPEGRVLVNYDSYFNIIMHTSYVLLAGMKGDSTYVDKANKLWPELKNLLAKTDERGLPPYAEQLLEGGRRVLVPSWGQARSCCVWGFTMMQFLPLPHWDGVLQRVLEELLKEPQSHWINGLNTAMAALDTWFTDETSILQMHKMIHRDTMLHGKYMVMPGAMPEKYQAKDGDYYHDIRPQGFAIGTWLGAYSNLGLRRLAYGLAMRPTESFEKIEQYPWKGRCIEFEWQTSQKDCCLYIDNVAVEGSLQVPEAMVNNESKIILRKGAFQELLWLKSTVELIQVQHDKDQLTYYFRAFGLSEITFTNEPGSIELRSDSGSEVECTSGGAGFGWKLYFEGFGNFILSVK